MTVEATYDRPSTKTFKVISQSGSRLVIDRVFKRLLESEKEAAEPEMRVRTLLNRNNYNIALTGYEPSATGGQYMLTVEPKKNSKYVYRGKVWVDGSDEDRRRARSESFVLDKKKRDPSRIYESGRFLAASPQPIRQLHPPRRPRHIDH